MAQWSAGQNKMTDTNTKKRGIVDSQREDSHMRLW